MAMAKLSKKSQAELDDAIDHLGGGVLRIRDRSNQLCGAKPLGASEIESAREEEEKR